jgi:universal stress protein A
MRNQRVLCPVDFSECASAALSVAEDLVKTSEGGLVLVHVYSVPAFVSSEAGFGLPGFVEQMEADSNAALSGWAAEAREHGVRSVETHSICGTPWDAIVRVARQRECDLIVMGTHGRSGLRHVLLGSVAENVVRHAPCSVLVVRDRKVAVST